MHTFTDPADGETYVSAYLGMDIAQRVFPCFDQNDLKAPIGLTVRAPEAWTVLANGRTVEADDGLWRFTTTPPIPPALFVVCAGPWHSMTWEHAGLPFGWHARRSLAAELERDAAELRAGHRCLLRPLRRDLRGAVPVRLLRPGLRARARTGARRRCRAA